MLLSGWSEAAEKPKVLLFSAVDSQYVADSLEFWGRDVGVNGFMLSYVADWWTPKNDIFKNVDLLKNINTRGKQYGIDSNFLNTSLGHGELPLWTDDRAWPGVIDNFRNIAELIKRTGSKGIALDTEPYTVALFDSKAPRFKSTDRNTLKAKVYQRGRETMLALTDVYPDIEVILLPEGAFYWYNPDHGSSTVYELWIDYFNGMASVKNNKGIVVAGERTYSLTDRDSLIKVSALIDTTMKQHTENPVFWDERCSVALGMWPLGREYDNKSAHYSPAEFKRQFSQAASLSPKYIWIYDHGSAWFQLKAGDVVKYTRGGRAIWGKDYQQLPTDPHIDDYYSVLRDYKKQ